MLLSEDKIVTVLLRNKTLKHSAPQKPLEPFICHRYSENEKLCNADCLQPYIPEHNKRIGTGGRICRQDLSLGESGVTTSRNSY